MLRRLQQNPTPKEKEAIWEELYVRYYNYVYMSINHFFFFTERVEPGDVLNTVFFKFFVKLGKRATIRRILHVNETSSYLRVMLTNIIKDMRKHLLTKTSSLVKEMLISKEDLERILNTSRYPQPIANEEMSEDEVVFLRDILKKLPCESREVIRLRIDKELPYKEISIILNKSESYLRKIYERGMHLYRELTIAEAEQAIGKGKWNDDMLREIINKLK